MLPPTFAKADSFEQAGHPSEPRDNERSPSAVRIEILQQSTKVGVTGRVSSLSAGRCFAGVPTSLAERASQDAPRNEASCRRILLSRSVQTWRAKAS